VLYQESKVSTLKTPRELIQRYSDAGTLQPGTLMFCGTPSAIGGIRPGSRFEMELADPVLDRYLRHGYDIDVLPVIS
jgi:2-keto-4-pentenoate hydratase/2-oxohepta-3-ene-1,7-dioic acid hydratase in catechol pathway